MTRDEIRAIAEVVGDDARYSHFVNRINKEFDAADSVRNANVYVLFAQNEQKNRVGFIVLGHSPAKMKTWESIFKEEGWVSPDFSIPSDTCFELMYVYIRPEYRRRGYGNDIFQRALAFSKEKGAGELYAYVSDVNPASFEFYKNRQAQVLKDLSDDDSTAAFLRWTI